MENDVRSLVKAITGFEENSENFRLCVQYVNSNFKYRHFLDVNSNQIQKTIKGLCDKFVIYCQDKKAQTFRSLVETFIKDVNSRTPCGNDLAYSILSLLLNLSASPTDNELSYIDENDSAIVSADEVDWGKYLLEGELDHSLISYHEYSEEEDEEVVEDTEDQIMSVETIPPERDDSGIDITGSTDSKSTNSQGPTTSTSFHPESKERIWLQNNIVAPYWNSHSDIDSFGVPSKAKVANLLKEWEEYLETFQLTGKNGNITLSERLILKEVLWMLQGVPDLALFVWKDGSFQVKPVQMSHVTDLTLYNFLSDLCSYGSFIKHLQQFIKVSGKLDFRSAVCSQTYQAFADSVNKSLKKFFEEITKFEKQLIDQNQTITLIQMTDELKSYFEEIKILYTIYKDGIISAPSDSPAWNRSVRLLTILFRYLTYHTTWTSNSRIVSLVLSIFLRTFRPYLKLLDDFISRGILNDPWQEFIVERIEINVLDENFWKNAFFMHPIPSDISQDFILQPLLSNIILAGKSMEIIRRLGCSNKEKYMIKNVLDKSLYEEFLLMLPDVFNKNKLDNDNTEIISVSNNQESKQMSIDKENFDKDFSDWLTTIINNNPLLHYNFSNMIKCTNSQVLETTIESLEQKAILSYSSQYPISISIKTVLHTCIERKCQIISKILIDILKEEYNLFYHMKIIRKFFLMELGDMLFAFYSEIFEKLCNGEVWKDMAFVNAALQDALLYQDLNTQNQLTVSLDLNHYNNRNNKLNELNSLHFSYKLSWPLNVILNFSSQQKYHEIFNFLMQVKCAKYALDELRFEELKSKKSSPVFEHESELPLFQKIHSMYLLRMRLLYFINNFHMYIMTQIQQHGGSELKKELQKAINIEQVLNSHTCYLAQIYEYSLLHPKFAILKDAITLILNLALNFQQCWKNGIDNVKTEKLCNIEKNFTHCVHFLHLHLKNTSQNKVISHLHVLLYSLQSHISLPPITKF
ncbi:gamma-tubulin complex component 5-like [Centruroides sculpturatus]|uniref:gamma-tubulin complex component 5-like n=1 Tax=Centruroides sculpturatus TaxID=218467 RepID=UPI000C6E8CA5|nr:gamma-tubulin complex component 5-like [Centruroides sculpturatus]